MWAQAAGSRTPLREPELEAAGARRTTSPSLDDTVQHRGDGVIATGDDPSQRFVVEPARVGGHRAVGVAQARDGGLPAGRRRIGDRGPILFGRHAGGGGPGQARARDLRPRGQVQHQLPDRVRPRDRVRGRFLRRDPHDELGQRRAVPHRPVEGAPDVSSELLRGGTHELSVAASREDS